MNNSINKILLIENQYFGCINYYLQLFQFTDIKIDKCESWQKMSFRNRCMVAGANGLIALTVPVENGRQQKALFKDVKIKANDNWREQHWKTIFSCYGKAPFFEFYADGVKQLIFSNHLFLFDLDMDILLWMKKILKIDSSISCLENKEEESSQSLLDEKNKWLPKNYNQSDLSIHYQQVFEGRNGFYSNLSILDILFNEGPHTNALLQAAKSG